MIVEFWVLIFHETIQTNIDINMQLNGENL